MKKNMNSFLRGKTLRYGSTAMAFTIAFVALIIVINIIFTAFAQRYMWYIDMTREQMFTLSDEVVNALSGVKDDVVITFCMDKDKVDENSALFYVHNTAKLLADRFDNITIDYRNALTDYDYLQRFSTASTDLVYTTSVIISSGTEYRKYNSPAFFIADSNDTAPWAYQGENTFASAILAVTADEMPIAYFTVGHGEYTHDDDEAATAFVTIIADAGYDVRTIDLSREDIDPAARLLIINDPKYDFAGYENESAGKSEIEKIDEFLDGFGSMMVFVSPENVGKLDNLSEFIEEWGISFNPGVTVCDTQNSVSTDGFSVVGQYNTDENELGSTIYRRITEMSSQPKAIFREATPITHIWDDDMHSMQDYGDRVVSDVFSASEDARLYSGGVPLDTKGPFSLMTITQEHKIIDNEDFTSYVLVSGTPDFVSAQYLISSVYSNRDVLHSCLIALGKENVPAGIQFKVFSDYSLDITTAQAASWTRALIIILPVCTAAAAIFVCVRRKYK